MAVEHVSDPRDNCALVARPASIEIGRPVLWTGVVLCEAALKLSPHTRAIPLWDPAAALRGDQDIAAVRLSCFILDEELKLNNSYEVG